MQLSNRQRASEILLDLSLSVEPRLLPLKSWFRTTYATIEKWYASEGNSGVKRAKEILLQGWLSILGEKVQELPYVKATKGLPDLVRPLVLRVNSLQKDMRLMSVTLSWVRMTDLFQGRPTDATVTPMLEVINDSKLPATAVSVIAEFTQFLGIYRKLWPDASWWKVNPKILAKPSSTEVTMFSESVGPNGKLVFNAHKDVMSLHESKTSSGRSLLDAINDLQQALCDLNTMSWKPSTKFSQDVLACGEVQDYSPQAGKLAFVTDKSAKVRVVAAPDYYTQYTLRPLHISLMQMLKTIPQDATHDQRSAIPRIVEWQNDGRYVASFDQSSCTDLFPFELQRVYLNELFGAKLSEAVSTVMVDRDWRVTLPSGRTRLVRWGVGQPLGAYASWPLMASTHHLLVQYAHWVSTGRKNAKWKPFENYVICGDDIVIADRRVAESYRKICTKLGMKINLSKSHISGKGTDIDPVSEFTKVTVWRGQPLFPIKPNQVLSSVKDWRMAIPLFSDLASRPGLGMKYRVLERVVKEHYSSRCKLLLQIIKLPTDFGGVGLRTSEPLRKSFDLLETSEIHPMLYYIALRIRKSLISVRKDTSLMEDVPVSVFREHPASRVLNEMSPVCYERTPSVREIISQLLVNGYQGYTHIIESWFQLPQEPFSRDLTERCRKTLTLWEESTSKKRYLDGGTSQWSEASLNSKDDPVLLSWLDSGFPDPFVAVQYGRVTEFMTLSRQAQTPKRAKRAVRVVVPEL